MEKYLFAAYIFLLGLLLVFILLRGLKRQSKQSDEVEAEERKLVELQIDLQDTILAMEAKIDETLAEFAAQKKDLEALAERIERKAAVLEEQLRENRARDAQTRDAQTREAQTRDAQTRDAQTHNGQPRDGQPSFSADSTPIRAAVQEVVEPVPVPPVAAPVTTGVVRIKPSAGIGAKNEARR